MFKEQDGIQVDKFYPPEDWQYSFPEGYTRLECLYNNGVIYTENNYVPVKENASGTLGMYDLVNNVFYPKTGSSYTAGKELYRNKTQIDIRSKVNLDYPTNYEFNSNDELTWANPDICLIYSNGEKHYGDENIAVVPAGLAYNNTTTPSNGYVDMRTQTFTPAPEGAIFKRERKVQVVAPEDNTITLLYGVASDFSKYALFGLLAQVSSGTYDVYIDDVLYATTTSNTQTDIDFSQLGSEYVPIGTAMTPESLVLHKIVIKPNTSGATITKFRCARTAGSSGEQAQGVVWCHFELNNQISIESGFGNGSAHYKQVVLCAITAKGNYINISSNPVFFKAEKLKYVPIFSNLSISNSSFRNCNYLKRIVLDNFNLAGAYNFASCNNIEQICYKQYVSSKLGIQQFPNNRKQKILPKFTSYDSSLTDSLTNCINLYPTKINVTDNTTTKLGMYGTSTYPMRGLQGLKVSNEAPFSGTSPQINVSYTGLGRNELVELFNSMPDVSQATDGISRAINITATSGNNLTKVGSPTIDENGIASGFSGSDYLVMQKPISGERDNIKQSFEIQTKITIGNTLPERGGLVFYPINGTDCGLTLIADGKIRFRLYGSPSYAITTNSNLISVNQTYWLKGLVKNNSAELLTSLDGINWTSQGTLDITDMPAPSDSSNTPKIGINGNAASTWSFQGSIDLENTYIKVGNNYIMKGYLLDSDRAIVTNKGWIITG